MFESGHMDSYLETRLRYPADSTIFLNALICRIVSKGSLLAPVAQLVKKAVHDQMEAVTVSAGSKTPTVNHM